MIYRQTIKEVDDEGCKYLGILELEKFKERKINDIIILNGVLKAV